MENKTFREITNEIVSGKEDLSWDELCVINNSGTLKNTIAHFLAYRKHIFPVGDKALELKDSTGFTVAHVMAALGHVFDMNDPAIRLTDDNGTTVAHEMALCGFHFPRGSEILLLKNNTGLTVADCYESEYMRPRGI